ncbi:beta strand repeat-containing protein [Pilimelia anulata]|uniref:beta strand repeat-containing protein n=1 Tax=Pilimelia anulata TaxID=53371 RepID=UPI00166362AA|nr:fibronectin type III domain-containing protein [Pilimelia anulata]
MRRHSIGLYRAAAITGTVALGVGSTGLLPTPASAAVPNPITYTDASQPHGGSIASGVCFIVVEAIGGQGGTASSGTGGKGGRVEARIAVTSSDTYVARVGDAGAAGTGSGNGAGGLSGGGSSGGSGGSGSFVGGGGGGSSRFLLNGSDVIVAAGGGGGSDYFMSAGAGGDGGQTGQAGTAGAISASPGGAGGSGGPAGGGGGSTSGAPLIGGNGGYEGNGSAAAGGGGGGGYFGGGGGGTAIDGLGDADAGGGGGGSNLAPASPLFNGTASGTGAGSITVTFEACTTPAAPTGLQLTRGNQRIDLSFLPPAGGGNPITSYDVSTDDGANWTTLTTSAGSGGRLEGAVTGLVNGTPYTVRVRAVNVDGNGTPSASETATPATTPAAPTSLVLTPGNQSLVVTFTTAGDGGSAITGYEVSTDNGSTWAAATTTAVPATSNRRTTVTGLVNGTPYTVRVRALNAVGNGTPSASEVGTPAAQVPDAPTMIDAAVRNGGTRVTFTPPADNGGSAITSYEVSTDNGSTWQAFTTAPDGASDRAGTVTGLTNGVSYDVRVRAVNSVGAGAASAADSVTPAPSAPEAPTGLSAVRGDQSADLTFTPPGDDGGSAITSYEVSTDNGSTWATLTTGAGAGGTRVGTVSGLTNGTPYTVRVRAVNVVGPSTASGSASVTPATTPGAPTGLSGVPQNSAVELTFTPPGNTGGSAITSYEVSTDNGTTWAALTTSAGAGGTRVGTVSGLSNGTPYTIRVRALNAVGNGAASGSVTETPVAAPAAPTGLSAVRGDQSAALTFSPPSDTGGTPITDYEVSTDNGSTWATLSTSAGAGGTRVGTVSGLTNGTPYTVRVRAVNAVGPGAASGSTSVTPATTPSAPSGLSGNPEDGGVALTFTPGGDGGSAITGYEVSTDNGTTWIALATAAGAGGTRVGTVSGLTNGTPYTIRVRALNTAGNGTASGSVTETPVAAPGAPTSLTADRGNQSADLVFTPPANTGGTAITGYEVSTDDGSTWATLPTAAGGGGTRTATVSGLTNGTPYLIRVRAVNAVGPGTASGSASVTPSTTPGAPTGLSGTPQDGGVALTLTPPGNTGGSAITSYEVSTDNGSTWATLTTGAGAGGTRVGTVFGLANGTPYTIRVRAVNAVGAGTASGSTTVTPATVPTAPVSLTGTPQNAGVALTFAPPASDGGSAVTGYEVSTDNGTTWASLPTTAGAGGSRVGAVTGLANGTAYAIRVRAVTGQGAGAASAAVTLTPGTPLAPRTVTAAAGTSSIEVSWLAPTDNGVAVTGYTATASPGPATCTTDGATSCVLGGTAGTAYTVTVVAHAAGGLDSAPSEASGSATPTAPVVPTTPPATELTMSTDKGDITTAEPGEEIVVFGSGFAEYSTVTITLYSAPIVLATVVTDGNGRFRRAVRVPANLAAGTHTFIAAGVDPDGNPHFLKLEITVAAAAGDEVDGELPVTGGGAVAPLVLVALTFLATGAVLCSLRWVRRREPAGS